MLTGLTGLRRGIAWLGDKNTLFYYILLAFIFLVGPIGYTLNLSTQSLGEFVQTFVSSMKAFPETAAKGGLIESELLPLKKMSGLPARSFLKDDAHLAIAGSVKARGGIYEVLKHTETLALENGLLSVDDDYSILADKRDFFENYKVQVGSTGNLGMSIGIMNCWYLIRSLF